LSERATPRKSLAAILIAVHVVLRLAAEVDLTLSAAVVRSRRGANCHAQLIDERTNLLPLPEQQAPRFEFNLLL
jgi:hypothetical protein